MNPPSRPACFSFFRRPTWLLLPALALLAVTLRAELRPDIEYGRAGDVSLQLDAYIPDGPGPHPVAILVHGGGWSRGDKRTVPEGDNSDITPWFGMFTNAGFTCFSVNYRLAPAHLWPACFDDVQTAIRWVKAHAAEFNGDPNRIVLVGHSAGGHLATLAAVRADADTRVQAVVGFAPVTDHEKDSAWRNGLSPALQRLLNRPNLIDAESARLLHEISSTSYIKPGLPPFFLIHGTADKSVRYEQSPAFQEKLRSAGVECELVTIPDAPHAFGTWTTLAPDYPRKLFTWLQAKLGADIKVP
jgi:alpha-L-fucosidase 2